MLRGEDIADLSYPLCFGWHYPPSHGMARILRGGASRMFHQMWASTSRAASRLQSALMETMEAGKENEEPHGGAAALLSAYDV